jgi:hypothetical protein
MTGAELRRRRAAAQLLAEPAGQPGAVREAVAHLLAVQAQHPRAARLALRARGGATCAGDVDAAFADGAIVAAWLLRGTLHLVAREDYAWLHALTGELTVATNRRRLAGLGVADPERGLAVIERALGDGPLDRAALAERLRSAGVPAEGQVVPHLIALAASQGTLLSVGDAYARTPSDLPAAPDRAVALAELARRYLRGHGPATAADLAAWSGLGLRDARAGLAAIAGEVVVDGDLVDLAGRAESAPAPPRLLPAFDPYLLGWKDRSFAVPPALARRVHPGGGMIRATAVDDGGVVGTWTMPGGRVVLEPASRAEAFADEVAAVERFARRAR